MLDYRRTPVRVAGIRPEAGFVLIQVDGFEDTGAVWEVPMENTHHFQFARGSARAEADAVAGFQEAVARFDMTVTIPAAADRLPESLLAIAEARTAAAAWLDAHSRFFPGGDREIAPAEGRTEPDLWADLRGFLDTREALELETEFTRVFVSNPYSGDCVKGHRLTLAEMGLVGYSGRVARDPRIFDGIWSRENRARHIASRLGFVREMLARFHLDRVELFRGMSFLELRPPENPTFVSSTFRREVAEAHFTSAQEECGLLYRQWVPADRVFMTFLETEAMNGVFEEAEAALLFQPGALF
jgi:hypothetical protein